MTLEREDFAKIWQKKLYFMLYHSLQYAFGGTRSRGSTRVIWGPWNMGRWGALSSKARRAEAYAAGGLLGMVATIASLSSVSCRFIYLMILESQCRTIKSGILLMKSCFIWSADVLIFICLWCKELLCDKVQSIRLPPPILTTLATIAVAVP